MFSPMVAIMLVSSSATMRERSRETAPPQRWSSRHYFAERVCAAAGNEFLESVGTADEIGLGIHFDHRARVPCEATPTKPSAATRPAFFEAADRPLVRNQSTACFKVTFDLVQRFLAIHHAGAGFLRAIP